MEKESIRVIATNRKAWHDYFITSKFEAGIVLVGTEVKAIREGKVNLKDSYAVIKRGELFLVGAHIGLYTAGNIYNHEPERDRKLLLNKREIHKVSRAMMEKGMTIVPLQVYFKNSRVKVEIGLAKGKRSYDKREAIAKKDYNRDQARQLKYN